MYIDLDEFYDYDLLNQAKNRLLEEVSDQIKQIIPDADPEFEIIEFKDARLELLIEDGWIDAKLNKIPAFLPDFYPVSNVVEYSKLAKTLRMLDVNTPPKFLAAKTALQKAELFLIAKLIENAILIQFDLNKIGEFQFYTLSGDFLGILTRIRLNRDPFTGVFKTYDFLIFSECYKIERKDIATLKDCLDIVDKADYCFEDLPEVLDDLEILTEKSYVEAEQISVIEKTFKMKVPKRPIFYRIPFLAWDRRDRMQFFVSEEYISEVIY
ncbi:MAG: hypothetical protein HWN65_18755 [Candidatus Helarchaeota archaeon]|nr:hypothetical protein [Candidatus Helarchaeota archaeon]